jgi:hypothetical protein
MSVRAMDSYFKRSFTKRPLKVYARVYAHVRGVCRYLDSIQSKVTDEIACEKQCSFNEDFICRSFAFYTSGKLGSLVAGLESTVPVLFPSPSTLRLR